MTVVNQKMPPIVPSSTPGGFLRSARLLPEGTDWKGGVTFLPNCGGTEAYTCQYGGPDKDIPETGDAVEFDPFLNWASERCSGRPFEELEMLVSHKLIRGTSKTLATEVHTSTIGNPDLITSASDITPATPPCINNAMAGLLSSIGDCGGGDAVFHVPMVGLASLMTYNLVEFTDGRYRLGGHTVIVDDYPNNGPGGAPAADEVWIYATGPVEYKLGEVLDIRHYENQQNEDALLKEQLAIVRFDPCCVYAIKAAIC